MAYRFSARSEARLGTVHPDLQRVMWRALSMNLLDFTILEGVRSSDWQRQLLEQGATRTMNSRHLAHPSDGLSRAVDVAPWHGSVSWDWPLYHRLAAIIKQAAHEENVPIEWGGDWKRLKDGPHWQLPWLVYP